LSNRGEIEWDGREVVPEAESGTRKNQRNGNDQKNATIGGKRKGNGVPVVSVVLVGIVLATTDTTTGANVPRGGINRLAGKAALRDKK